MKAFLILSIIGTLRGFDSHPTLKQGDETATGHNKKRHIPFSFPQANGFGNNPYGSPQFAPPALNQFAANIPRNFGQQFPQPFYGQQGMALPSTQFQSFSPPFPHSALPSHPHALAPNSLPPFSPQAFSPQSYSPQALPSQMFPSAGLPFPGVPQAFPPNSFQPQLGQQPFSAQQFSSPYSTPQFNPAAFAQAYSPQTPKTFGSALTQRAGYQFGFQQSTASPQNEVESSHEVQSSKSHISSSDQQNMVPPESQIEHFDDKYSDKSGYISQNSNEDEDKSPSYMSNSYAKNQMLKNYNFPQFLYSMNDNDPYKSNETERVKVTRSSGLSPYSKSYDTFVDRPKKGFVKIHFGNTRIEY